MRRALLRLGMATALAAAAAGCVERTISVTTEPSGALVYLNDEEVGRTPLTVPFTHYGVYDVRIECEGCEPLWTTAEARTPLWDLPGPDLLAEALPGARSEVKWHFTLAPKAEVSPEALLDRARQMRALTARPDGGGERPDGPPADTPATPPGR